MPRRNRSSKRGPDQRRVDGASFHLADALFSTQTGDAWIIDRDDRLAFRLAHQGDHEPFHIKETDTSFTIDWKGHYRIEGEAFIFVDRKTRGTRTILGYPTQKLEQAARGS